jgi:hypothetical protein
MIQATMHEWVRYRLHDTGTSQRHSPAMITSALNLGAQKVQLLVQKADPDAFRRNYQRNLQADDYRYQMPRGLLRAKDLYLKYSASSAWVRAERAMERDIEDPISDLNQQGSGDGTPQFTITGGEVVIWPTPDADVENGLKLLYVPSLGYTNLEEEVEGALNTTGADEDLSDYGLVEPFHKAVWLWAVHTLLPNEGDSEAQKLVEYEFKKVVEDIPGVYGGTGLAGGIEEFRVERIGLELR